MIINVLDSFPKLLSLEDQAISGWGPVMDVAALRLHPTHAGRERNHQSMVNGAVSWRLNKQCELHRSVPRCQNLFTKILGQTLGLEQKR